MGDIEKKKLKAESFIHYGNMNVVNNVSMDSLRELGVTVNKCRYTVKKLPHEKLPKEIFELPRVKEFLLPG